jgi:hypothetical protein
MQSLTAPEQARVGLEPVWIYNLMIGTVLFMMTMIRRDTWVIQPVSADSSRTPNDNHIGRFFPRSS